LRADPHTEFDEKYFRRRSSSRLFKGRDVAFLKHPFWDRVIRRRVPSGKLLDIGCAEGFLLKWAEKRGYNSYGMDISTYAISQLSTKRSGSKLCLGSIEALPFIDGCFDVITCFDVLEHLEQPLNRAARMNRCLKTGGVLVMSTPNTCSHGLTLKGDSWFGYRDTTHVSLLSPGEWISLFGESDFDIVDKFYDVLWDAPYLKHIPSIMQRACCSALVLLHYWTPVRFPHKWGENLYVVARKKKGCTS